MKGKKAPDLDTVEVGGSNLRKQRASGILPKTKKDSGQAGMTP